MKWIIMGVLVIVVAFQGLYQSQRENVVATISKSERVCSSGENSTCKYLVFTDKEVFENTDTLLNWKFDSSDFYSDMKVGVTYNFDVIGWRIPFLSAYRNIINYSEIR